MPAQKSEQIMEANDHAIRRQFYNAVMVNLARSAGSKAEFQRAYRYDAARGGWHETPWGSAQASRLYAEQVARLGPSGVAAMVAIGDRQNEPSCAAATAAATMTTTAPATEAATVAMN